MIRNFIDGAMENATFEVTAGVCFGRIDELPGVWASGADQDDCRDNLTDAVGQWFLYRLFRGKPIPALN